MTDMSKRYPALHHLLGAYFHQDWDLMYDDNIWLVLDDFMRNSADLPRRLPWEIDRLLPRCDDEELTDYLYAGGCCYTAHGFPGGHREWLTEVAKRARLGPDDSLLPPPFTDWRRGRYSMSFSNEETEEHVTSVVIDAHEDEIGLWLNTDQDRLVIEGTFLRPVGTVGNYDLGMSEQHTARVILAQDSDQPGGFRVVNSFPEFPRRGRTDLPGLRHLGDAYFHRQWREEHDYDGLIAAFATGSGPHADELLEEIERLRPLSEDELEQIFDEFGLQFSLVRDETWHAWLDDLETRIREARGT